MSWFELRTSGVGNDPLSTASQPLPYFLPSMYVEISSFILLFIFYLLSYHLSLSWLCIYYAILYIIIWILPVSLCIFHRFIFVLSSSEWRWRIRTHDLKVKVRQGPQPNPSTFIFNGPNSQVTGREPWFSGYGRRLIIMRLWVRIPVLNTGWTCFTLFLL